jgi:hypothetical protein
MLVHVNIRLQGLLAGVGSWRDLGIFSPRYDIFYDLAGSRPGGLMDLIVSAQWAAFRP